MSTRSSSDIDGDLESQQAVLLISSNTPRTHWSRIYLILRVRFLILRERKRKLRADSANKASHTFDRSSSSSTSYYSIISTDGTVEAVSFLSCLSSIDFYIWCLMPDHNLSLVGLGFALYIYIYLLQHSLVSFHYISLLGLACMLLYDFRN